MPQSNETSPHAQRAALPPATCSACLGGSVGLAIMQELYQTVELLGGDSQILGSIGSFGDTLPPEMVLSGLKAWNEDKRLQATNNSGRKEANNDL